METVIVSNSQFYSHYPRKIPKGSVNAEQVEIRLDKSWDGLTVRIHWLNVASNVEKKPLLELDQPNTIPWEVLTDLGELRMGLVGLDGETVIKPTIWLTYGYVSDGVDPESGSDPQPPTPSWEQQMVEQATQANQAAQAAQKAAEEAAESAASAGPYADEAKKSAEAAKASQDAAATSARQANEAAQTAQDAVGSIGDSVDRAEGAAKEAWEAKQAAETAQAAASNSAGTAQGAATTASEAAKTAQEAATKAGEYLETVKQDADNAESAALEAGKSQEAARDAAQEAANARDQANTAATAADTAKGAAEQAATTAGNAQSGAAQSAQAAANSAQAAERAKQDAQNAASALPAPSPEFAGMVPMVNPEGNGYIFGEAGGGGAGGELLLAEYIHQGNQEIYFSSFDWSSGIGECTEPHGLTEAKKVLLVPNEWWTGSDFMGKGITSIPIEWIIYTGANIYVVPTDETHVKITGSDKETIIQVDIGDVSNTLIDATKFHVELPVGFSIKELPVDCTSIRVFAFGITGTLSYRYISLYTNRIYSARIWPEGFLTPPATGLSKAKYALVFWYDICAEAVPAGAVFVMNNLYKAQRKGYSYWVGDRKSEYLVTNYGMGSDNKAEIFTGLLIENGNACYANHTVFRLYARAVKQE